MCERYELIYGFVHCRGRTTYSAGFVNSRTEAEAWLLKNREAPFQYIKAPPEDPIRFCKAALCPLKRQKPWFDVRVIRESSQNGGPDRMTVR